MIHHVSIPARNPRRVAEVLAELMNGTCIPFDPLEDAFMATGNDLNGTAFEVYPEYTTLNIPDYEAEVLAAKNPSPPQTWPFHVFLSVPREAEEVEAIGVREGWRVRTFGRGVPGQKPFFHVIEFWLENRLLIEVATPAMTQEYLDFQTRAQTEGITDPESVPLLRTSHLKAPQKQPA
jgi:hypothetical protein